MAKKHKNLENILIQWDGDLSKPSDGSAQSSPDNIDITWGGYVPCWVASKTATYEMCVVEDMYYEDFNSSDPIVFLEVIDVVFWINVPRDDIVNYLLLADDLCTGGTQNVECIDNSVQAGETTYLAPKTTYTWNDLYFLIEIADGIGTGNRRAREARLQQFDKNKRKKIIHLICRIKGEKVYDDKKETLENTEIKIEDVDMVINEVLGKMKVETKDVI